jgi:hypothetical protein
LSRSLVFRKCIRRLSELNERGKPQIPGEQGQAPPDTLNSALLATGKAEIVGTWNSCWRPFTLT